MLQRPSDDALRLLVDAVQDYAIFLLDPKGYIQTWNTGARRLKGYAASEIIGRHFSTFYTRPDLDADVPAQELVEAARVGRVEAEGWRLRKDGSRFWANVIITALRDGSGTLVGFGKVTRDLTRAKMAEEELRRSEESFRLLVEGVRDYAIFMLDPDGNVLTWNAGAKRFKGYDADEIIGRHFSVFYPPEDVAAGKCDRELVTATSEGRVEDEGWRVRKDGSRLWANVVITALRGESGALLGFAKLTRDLTERRQAQQQLLDAEVARARAETRAEEAAGKVRSRDEFISVASHELRTPLAAARLHAESLQRLLKRKGAGGLDKAPDKLKHILEQVDRLEQLTATLLDASRIALGRLGMQLERVDLSELARVEAARYGDQLTAAGCKLTLRANGPVVGNWDRMRLEQVLVNLMTNAMKYGAGKPIEIEVASNDGTATLRVTDHGIGIARADQARIFDRFERAVSERHFAGLGLGLWITRQIVDVLGGRISVESEPGAGARFTVELPR